MREANIIISLLLVIELNIGIIMEQIVALHFIGGYVVRLVITAALMVIVGVLSIVSVQPTITLAPATPLMG